MSTMVVATRVTDDDAPPPADAGLDSAAHMSDRGSGDGSRVSAAMGGDYGAVAFGVGS
jgi:hypothetical protein